MTSTCTNDQSLCGWAVTEQVGGGKKIIIYFVLVYGENFYEKDIITFHAH